MNFYLEKFIQNLATTKIWLYIPLRITDLFAEGPTSKSTKEKIILKMFVNSFALIISVIWMVVRMK